MTKKTLRWFVPAAVLYAAGFVLAALWDLPINQAVYRPGNLFAILMESFGWYPAFFPPLLLAMLWIKRPGLARKKLWQPALCALVAAGGLVALYYSSYNYLLKRGLLAGPTDFSRWLWLAAGLLAAGMLLAAAFGCSAATRLRLSWLGLCGSVLCAANQAAVYPLKLLWARTRFDDMLAAGSFDAFTPWFRPLGFGGSSFPSGHTANAACVFAVLVLCDVFPGLGKRRRLLTALCWVYIGLMAAARVLIGRHFLSDTLAASLLMAGLFYALRHNRYYQKGLARVRERLQAAEETHAA